MLSFGKWMDDKMKIVGCIYKLNIDCLHLCVYCAFSNNGNCYDDEPCESDFDKYYIFSE